MTCLCLTKNRRRWLPQAIACWRAQTYRNSELLILADGEDVRDAIPDDVRYVYCSKAATIGEKRNLGCELSGADVIAHWDDDDWSAPGRIAEQIDRLSRTGKSVVAYHSMLFRGNGETWLYTGQPVGTSLCYRRDWWLGHKFAPVMVGEDNSFVAEARVRGVIDSVDAGDLMIASIHDGNTSPRQLSGSNWRKVS